MEQPWRLQGASSTFNERVDSMFQAVHTNPPENKEEKESPVQNYDVEEYSDDEEQTIDKIHTDLFQKDRLSTGKWNFYSLSEVPDHTDADNMMAIQDLNKTRSEMSQNNNLKLDNMNDDEEELNTSSLRRKRKAKIILTDESDDM